MKKTLLTLAILTILANCNRKKSDDPKPDNTFLTVKIATGWYHEDAFWIFATDKAGNVIDVEENLDGTVYLQSDQPVEDSIALTYFIHLPDGEIILQTRLLAKNTTYEPPFYTQIPRDTLGYADITIPGYQTVSYSELTLGDEVSFDVVQSISGEDASRHYRLLKDQSDWLVSGFRDGVPVYSIFEDVKEGDHLTKAFSEFTLYPHAIPLDFPTVNASLYGFRSHGEDAGYLGFPLSSFVVGFPGEIDYRPSLGYSDEFDSFQLNAQRDVFVGDHLRIVSAYFKRGAISTGVTLPEYDYTLVDDSFETFEFTFPYPNAIRGVNFNGVSNANMQWSMTTTTNNFPIIREIPEEISGKYPEVNLSNFTLNSFSATLITSGSVEGSEVEGNAFLYHVE